MSTNRITRYFRDELPAASSLLPPGFVMVPVNLVSASVSPTMVQQLHLQALSAAIVQVEEQFEKLMRSLRN